MMRYYNDMGYGLIVDSEDDFETKMSVDQTVELLNKQTEQIEKLSMKCRGQADYIRRLEGLKCSLQRKV